MTFQIKDFRSIVASMINQSRASQSKITDFSVGSVVRTLIEAPAIEIEELYLQMLLGLQEAIPVSVFSSFNFDRLAAVGASGVVRFTAAVSPTSDILIPTGTLVKSTDGSYQYATSSDAIIHIGETYVDAVVVCNSTGALTNCLSSTLTSLVNQINGVTSVTNAIAFTNGRDLETDGERKTRFQFYISTISRGTTSALRYGALQSILRNSSGEVIERVAQVAVIEPYVTDDTQPIGLVNIYIHNGTGETSSDLVARVTEDINGYYETDGTPVPGWKAAGVHVVVYAATEVSINVTGVVTMVAGASKPPALILAAASVNLYIKSLAIGSAVVLSEIISIIMAIDGVYNVVLSAPTADTSIGVSSKAMPGTIALS